jgi:hypothetical protein
VYDVFTILFTDGFCKAIQLENAPEGLEGEPVGSIVTLFNIEQLLKAVCPIDVIVFALLLLTKLILSKLGLFAKEFTPIVCIYCPKTDVPDVGPGGAVFWKFIFWKLQS